jgi:hypothetical protein
MILMLCAVHSFGFAAFHALFWRTFGWPETLRETTAANRAILQIANVQLIWVFVAVGALCLTFPSELAHTPLGRAALAGMALFWLIRLVCQFVWLRVNDPLVHTLSALFFAGAVLFGFPLLDA